MMGKFVDNSTVTIKPLAYYKMLLHILRFGSKYLEHDKLKEVMGILIGHLEGEGEIKNVIIEDVVPVSHGGTIEVKFSIDQLGAFGELDSKIWEQFGDLGWFSIGWYHSHPGLGIFFSDTDKYNQIFWQKSPSGIGIVFDHTYLDKPGDLGFRIFRLDERNLNDPSLAMKSNYHSVKAIVEPPNDLEFYIKIMELINKVHTGIPQILELNETVDMFSDVIIPQEEQLTSKLPQINSEEIVSVLKNGMEAFIDLSLKPIIYLLNSWGQDTISRIAINNSLMRNDLNQLKDKLSNEIINLQKTFNYDLQNNIKDLDFYVDDKLEELDQEKVNIKTLVTQAKEEFGTQISILFEEKSHLLYKNLQDDLVKVSSDLEELINKNLSHLETQERSLSKLNSLIERYRSLDNFIKSNLNTAQEDTLSSFGKNANKVMGNLTALGKETKTHLSSLKAAIIMLESSKISIKNKLDTLQTENKELQKSVKDLRDEKQDLLKEIKKLEKKGE
ncbi:hypothetical protein LCGC14_0943820 [marine sediment metagenome]|uniref:MPN domain-containing protein n=1 Tax=marine sediment metagenome TaxID=412755 RepID=A0A0F9P5D1_9ZZZZ